MRDVGDVALALVTGALASGGATVSPRVNEVVPQDGYAVGIPAHGVRLAIADLRPWQVTGWLESVAETIALPGVYVGSWVHDGTLFLDVVLVHETEGEALDAARLAGEVAVFDLSAREEVLV